jgi:serine/threonine protein kinase
MAGVGGQTSSESGESPPQTLGDYVLLRRLGQGGMGQVWLAKLRGRGLAGIDKLCVVKTLRATGDPEYERRFIDEARLIVLLTHKNICPVFDAGCFEGQYYVAMEHIAGRDLYALGGLSREQQAPLPVPVAIHIAKELLEALDAAHRMLHPITQEPLLIVHRDVSPHNVMVSAEGDVKLIDFGLAASSQKAEKTEPQVVMGKLAYMAPEQARGEALDDRTDQFAAGVILYELLANARYYEGLTASETWGRVGVGGYEPPGLARIDEALGAIVRRATAARRDDRYATCGDMCEALTAVELSRGAIASSRDVRLAVVELERRAGLTSTTSPELRRLERGLGPGLHPSSVSHPPGLPASSGPVSAGPVSTSGGVQRAVSASSRVVSAPAARSATPAMTNAGGSLPPSSGTSGNWVSGIVSSSLPTLMPSPFEPAAPRPGAAAPEHTRTFRIRRGQSGEPLVERTESGSSAIADALFGVTETATNENLESSAERTEISMLPLTQTDEAVVRGPAIKVPASSVPAHPRTDSTMVFRGGPTTQAIADEAPSPLRPRRIVAGAGALVAALAGVGLWWGSRVSPVAVASIDAGVSVEAVERIDAGRGNDQVVVDAGSDSVVVPVIVDAGVNIQPPDAGTSIDPGAGAVEEPRGTKNGTKPEQKPRLRRQLGPLPEGVQISRVKFLQKHCDDVPCFVKLGSFIGSPAAEPLIKDCYQQCSQAPPRVR